MPLSRQDALVPSKWWTPVCAGCLCLSFAVGLTILRQKAQIAHHAASAELVLDVFKDDQLVARFIGVKSLIAHDKRGRCQPPYPCAFGSGVRDKNLNFQIDMDEPRELFEAADYGDGFSLYAHPASEYWP